MYRFHTAFATSFSFHASFIGGGLLILDSGWQEISGLSSELSVEEIHEGGENRFAWRLPKPATYKNLVLKRAVRLRGSELQLQVWANEAIQHFKFSPCTVIIAVLDENHLPIRVWNFVDAYPVKLETSGLNAAQSELQIETLELAYKYFNVITI